MLRDIIFGVVLVAAVTEGFAIDYFVGELDDAKRDSIYKDISIHDLQVSLDKQNKAIDDIKVDYEARIADYEKFPKIKYIEKYITKDVNVTRSSCEDVDIIFSELRRLGID